MLNLKLIQNLRPGDRVIVPKSLLGAVQHHAIYAGNGYFYENKDGHGVVKTHALEFFKGVSKVTSIQKFTGNEYQRRLAIQRAETCLGKEYNLKDFNCEHFANYVQFGQAKSHQVDTALTLGLIGLFALVVYKAAD